MNREILRAMTKNLYDFQDMRIRYAGRLKIKSDETPVNENAPDYLVTKKTEEMLQQGYEEVKKVEKSLEKDLEKVIKQTSEWKLFLKDVKGVGPKMAAVLISEIDIQKATTVSRIWQYAGLNPNKTVKGKVKKGDVIVESDEYVKGDRPTKGYLIPYNAYLKKKLLGVLADCFIKSKSEYTKFYYDMKHRLETSTKFVNGTDKMWKDESALHRDRAAKRYMIQMFLIDYYKAVRKIYNLEVRPSYAEEKLGQVHHTD